MKFLQAGVIAEDGDVIVECFQGGDVILTVRNFSETESHAAIRLTFHQAGTLSDLLQRADIPDE
jgi:hypothetical protein